MSNRSKSRLAAAPIEQRVFALSTEARSTGGLGFRGHAAVFGQRTAIGNPLQWGFYEQCAAGCFSKTLQEADVIFVQDHDPSRIMARTSNGTLRLAEDTVGLDVDADMADVSYARDLAVLLDRGDVKGMSFRFQVVKDEWSTEDVEVNTGDGGATTVTVEVRTLQEVKLVDVCTTALPAYPQTDAGLRSLVSTAHEARRHGGHGFVPLTEARHTAVADLGDRARDELRAGKTLSADTLAELQQVLDLIASADDAVDQAQPILAALMGVPNPDADDDDPDDGDDADAGRSSEPSDTDTRASNGTDEPARTTRHDAESLAMRQRALAVLYGLPAPAAADPIIPEEGTST